jgi:hypothetical protein
MYLTTRRVFFFLLLLALFVLTTREITDPDFWWHLRTGQYIFETKTIPHADIYSHTYAGREWVAHEWLSELFIYAVYKLSGWAGLVITFTLIMTAAFGISFFYTRSQSVHPYVAGLAVLVGAITTAPTWGVRPQVISLLLTSVFVAVLGAYARGHIKLFIWCLPPLVLLWVNLHGAYALGLALILLTLVGLVLDAFVMREERAQIWPCALMLSFVFVVCVLVVPLNPNGLRMFSYPFETIYSPVMQEHIEEWFSPNFHQRRFLPLAFLIFSTFSALALSPTRPRPSQLLLLVASGYAVLRSGRHLPIFAFVAAPLLAEHAWEWIKAQSWSERLLAPSTTPERLKGARQTALNFALLIVALAVCVLNTRQVLARQAATEARAFPAAAVEYLRAAQLPGPVYNWYDWGGYLIWKLYPQQPVYIDGRADVYGDRFITEFLKTSKGEGDWREPLRRHGIRTIVVKKDSTLATLLQLEEGWTKAFEDQQAVIFIKQ